MPPKSLLEKYHNVSYFNHLEYVLNIHMYVLIMYVPNMINSRMLWMLSNGEK